MPNGSTGNVKQGHGVGYVDDVIEQIPATVNKHLAPKKLIGVILSIEKTEGEILN